MNKVFYISLFSLLLLGCSQNNQNIVGKWKVDNMSFDANRLDEVDVAERLFPVYVADKFSKEDKLNFDITNTEIRFVLNDSLIDTATITKQSSITNDSLVLETNQGKFAIKLHSDKNLSFTSLDNGIVFNINRL
ncbi:MAG: hypothetical protein Q4B43_03745 [Bacteroidota bacterium]|nr:hypothetical protein [Bacteroidota bacterium]